MATVRQDFIGYVGDAFPRFDVAVIKDGNPLNLANIPITMTWRRFGRTGVLLAEFTRCSNMIVDDEAGGLFHVAPFVPNPQWPLGKHWYDIEIVEPVGGLPTTLVIGNWRLQQDVGGP